MITSWISFLLPDDEYKRQRVVYFLAEGSVIVLTFLVSLFCIVQLTQWHLDVEVMLGSIIVVFIFYVFLRYTFSGIEYTDVSKEKQYKIEMNILVKKSLYFAFIFFFFSWLFGVSNLKHGWLDYMGISVLAGLFMFIINYISLNRSYKMNKDIIDD